jgi:hypothetical protein
LSVYTAKQIFLKHWLQFQSEEIHQSRILFIIVAVFLICSLPRAILNLVEFEFVFVRYFAGQASTDSGNVAGQTSTDAGNFAGQMDVACFDPPVWSVILNHVSSFLMTLNASLGFFIYCLICKQFRKELKRKLRWWKHIISLRRFS